LGYNKNLSTDLALPRLAHAGSATGSSRCKELAEPPLGLRRP